MQQPNEHELIAQAQRGDEEAVTLLYEMHVDAIFAYISHRVDSRATAEDLTSEVFLRMVRGLTSYKDHGIPFRAWLFRIASNLTIDYYRRRKKTSAAPLPDEYESEEADPFEVLAGNEEQMRLRLALRALPETYQDLLILRFVDDLPHTEIASILNKSADALRALQYRAVKALAEQFDTLNKRSQAEDE